MKLPKKITPDRIRDSIVQVFIKTEIPFEPLVGYLFGTLSEMGFAYSNELLKQPQKKTVTTQPNEIVVNLLPQHLYFNEEIKIQLHQSGSLIFNSVNKYIGWSKFASYIQSTLTKLVEQNVIQGYSRVGIRYISEFPNIDLLDKLNFSFNLQGLNQSLQNGSFRFEWNDSPHKIVVNLGMKLPIGVSTTVEGEKIDFISLIDIDVINMEVSITKNEELFAAIEAAHLKQKEIFFGLLREDFLESLNPDYEETK